MAFLRNILNIPLDGTGTEIPTLSVNDPYDSYLITGAITAIGNYTIVPTGTPQQGTTFIFEYEAVLDITTNGTTFLIFGVSLTQTQLSSKLYIECYYNGSAWKVKINGSLDQAFITGSNLVNNTITATQLANNSVTTNKILANNVTNAKLAQMAAYTLKGNATGATADPQDISISSLTGLNYWGLTGNAGTTAGTNFIGTTDAVDLVFKVNNIKAGILSINNNTSFGYSTLLSLTSGTANAGFGIGALASLTSGSTNAAFGHNAFVFLTTGSNNTGVGKACGAALTTGSNNVFIGQNTGTNLTNGSSNTIIGNEAYVSLASSSNRIALGANALATADYQFAIPDDVTELKFLGVTSIKLDALPSYDDNADAISGGLGTGELFVASGGGSVTQGVVCQVY